jgi:hypothetical protein
MHCLLAREVGVPEPAQCAEAGVIYEYFEMRTIRDGLARYLPSFFSSEIGDENGGFNRKFA